MQQFTLVLEIKPGSQDDYKKLEHHFEYLFNTDSYPKVIYQNIKVQVSKDTVTIKGETNDKKQLKEGIDIRDWKSVKKWKLA